MDHRLPYLPPVAGKGYLRSARNGRLEGARILLVEDDVLLAMSLRNLMRDAGAQVIGPVGRNSAALGLLRRQRPDAAVLDVRIGEDDIFPVCEVLSAAGIPFIFLTGYGKSAIPGPYQAAPLVDKLSKPTTLISTIAGVLP